MTMYQTYPMAAYDTLKKMECIWPLADIVLQHRKCWDGLGPPSCRKGEAILIEARILAVAHALEDLTTHRSYRRSAFPIDEALGEISAGSGSKYDPDVTAACLERFREQGLPPNGGTRIVVTIRNLWRTKARGDILREIHLDCCMITIILAVGLSCGAMSCRLFTINAGR